MSEADAKVLVDVARTLEDLEFIADDMDGYSLKSPYSTPTREGIAAIRQLQDEVDRLKRENAEVEKDWDEIDGFMNRIDGTICESLEKIGEFPGKPAGFPDRVDVACRLLESIPQLRAEIARLQSADAGDVGGTIATAEGDGR